MCLKNLTQDDSNLTITKILKKAVKKKLRLSVTGYYQGEYLYTLTQNVLAMFYKEYGVKRKLNITT